MLKVRNRIWSILIRVIAGISFGAAIIYLFLKQRYRLTLISLALAGLAAILIVPYQFFADAMVFLLMIFKVRFALRMFGYFINPAQIAYVLFLGSLFLALVLRPKDTILRRPGIIEWSTLIFFAVMIVSAIHGLLNKDIFRAFSQSSFNSDVARGPIFYLWIVFFSIFIFRDEKSIERTALLGGLGLFLQLLYGVFEFFTMGRRSPFMGVGLGVTWGYHFQPMVILSAVLLQYALITRKKSIFALSAFVYLFIIFFRSRTSILYGLMLIFYAVLATSLIQPKGKRLKYFFSGMVYYLISLIVIAGFLYVIMTPSQFKLLIELIAQRFKPTFAPGYDLSVHARAIELKNALALYRENKLLGQGFGTTFFVFKNSFYIDHCYGIILAKMGLLGLFSFLFMYFSGIFIGLRLLPKIWLIESDIVKSLVLVTPGVLAGLLIAGFYVSHPFFSMATIICVSILMAAVSFEWNKLKRKA